MTDQQLLETQRRLQRQHGIKPSAEDPTAAELVAGMVGMVAAKAEAGAETETEYLAADGLLRCRICGGPRQTVITPPFEGAQPRTVRCWCSCPTEYDRMREREKLWKMETDRNVCFQDAKKFLGWTFDKDDGKHQELMDAARAYAEQFPAYMKTGKGLLLYGDVGTGKSVAAACIAHAVLKMGYRAKMTSIGAVADELWNAEDKAAYLQSLAKYDLLILDDLGTERKTDYMQEMAYKIINARYVAGGPMIVTTNLTKEELGKPADMGYKRIYSRILENCLAINVDGSDRRMAAAGANKIEMRKQLGMEV